jgi:deoxyribodipyrimidine photo-lyase
LNPQIQPIQQLQPIQPINVVWLKRDLRLQDHAPLCAALTDGTPALLLYCFEPGWMQGADSDVRHWRFVRQSLDDLQRQLADLPLALHVLHGDAAEVLADLHAIFSIKNIFSHAETGNAWTYMRDLRVAFFCKKKGITWHESPTNGVVRRLYHRRDWEQRVADRLRAPLAMPDWSLARSAPDLPDALRQKYPLDTLPEDVLTDHPDFQPGGEGVAWRYLRSFLTDRRRAYYRHISKPEAARRSCSRISPYLTWGCLSVRQAYQAAKTATEQTNDRYNLGQFVSRLFWQSHFVQKLETEWRMEFENMNRGFDLIRTETDPALVAAWAEGRTGYPLVDACMRCVVATGYLNFRMRAMLVSFLTHYLWQPWQAGVHHLARQFLDYEPGIHYAQFQMQAGSMGVNTLRIYNPVKQSLEHDAEGVFLKKWLPELAHLPLQFVHEPWKMTPMEAELYRFRLGEDYPSPIVDIDRTYTSVRDRLWAHRQHPAVLADNERILRTHTKRRSADETTVVGEPEVSE